MFKRFSEVSQEYILSEMHVHSTWTDGSCSLSALVDAATSQGLRRLFFTDHIRKESTYYDAYIAQGKALKEKSKIAIKVGFESKIADNTGRLDIPEAAMEQADVLIGTVHSIPRDGGFAHPSLIGAAELENAEYELSLAMLSAKSAHVLGHAGGMSLSRFGNFRLDYLERIIAECAENGVAFEVNSRYHAGTLDWLMGKLAVYNPLIAIGSDAHSLSELGVCSNIFWKRWKQIYD